MRHGIKARLADTQLSSNLTQFTTVAFVTNQTRFRMLSHQEADDVYPVIFYPRRVSPDSQVRKSRSNTGSHDPAGFFILNQTKTAGAKRQECMMMAKSGYFYTKLFSSI
jgi:hypothetical protein